MIGIDTNILVRFLVDDEPDQNATARAFLAARSHSDPAFISAVTLAETVWVLTRRMNYPVAAVVRMLRELLASEGLVIEYAEELGSIVFADIEPEADIADYLIAWAGAANGCSRTITFDRRAAKSVLGMELLA